MGAKEREIRILKKRALLEVEARRVDMGGDNIEAAVQVGFARDKGEDCFAFVVQEYFSLGAGRSLKPCPERNCSMNFAASRSVFASSRNVLYSSANWYISLISSLDFLFQPDSVVISVSIEYQNYCPESMIISEYGRRTMRITTIIY